MAFVPINDLSRWEPHELAEINSRIQAVVASGYFMLGKNTEELEQQISRRLNNMNVFCVGNGTDALAISLLGLGLQPGDKVATVANAGGYATGAILRVGCTPVLIDVDKTTAQLSPKSFLNVLEQESEIKAVVVTHLYGLMADIDIICKIASERDIFVIEDCAQAIGASRNGREAGAWGDAATFSFYPTKNLGCLGDGGAVAFRNEDHFKLGRQVAQYGWSQRYIISELNGFNSRLDELQAAVLLERIKVLNENNQQRRNIVRRYSGALSDGYKILWRDDESYIGHLAILTGPSRSHIQQVLDSHQIGHGIHYPLTDNQQPAWKELFSKSSVPNCEELAQEIVTLPCFPSMTDAEITQVCVALHSL